MADLSAAIDAIVPELTALRHDLHRHPELGYQEHWTRARLLEELKKLPGLSIRSGLAETGIAATLNADRAGRCVALRADMDALPLQEANTFDYRSTRDGCMHACGHDGHMACLIGAAKVLSQYADELPGKVKFVFQPAEEGGAGGRRMVEEGVLDDPPVDAAFAIHGWPETELGRIIVGAGPILAGANTFEIKLTGKGTHAAYPHLGTDLVVAASQIVTELQVVGSRFFDPVEPVVVSVAAISAGQTYNVLPDHATLMGTVRSLSEDILDRLKSHVQRIVEAVASNFSAGVEITWLESYPPLINDKAAAGLATRVATELVGEANVDAHPPPTMGAEDFAFFAQRAASVMWRLGICPPGPKQLLKLHDPRFDFADTVIPLAVAMHCRIAERFLAEGC